MHFPSSRPLNVAAFACLAVLTSAAAFAENAPTTGAKPGGDATMPAKPVPTTKVPGPAAPAPAANQIDEAKAAWDKLSLEDRRAIQDALVWTGDYNGGVDGAFGKGTLDALKSFETHHKLNADGTVDAEEAKGIVSAGTSAKAAAKFTLINDAATGVAIGVPLALVGTPTRTEHGTAWTATSKQFTEETFALAETDKDLPSVFQQLKADTRDGRKVDYSVIKPDWLVVAGQTNARKFYTRISVNGDKHLRGFTFSYEKGVAPVLEKFAVAIANSFDPTGKSAPASASAKPEVAAKEPSAPTQPAALPAPVGPMIANGLVVAPGKVLTVAAAVAKCTSLTVGASPASVAKLDKPTGLALLEAPAAKAPPASLPVRANDPSAADPLVVLGFTEAAGKPGPLSVTSGETVGGPAKPGLAAYRVLTQLQPGGTGALVTDRTGALVALVAAVPRQGVQIAGIQPQTAYDVVPGPAIGGFLGAVGIAEAQPGTAQHTTGEIAAAVRGAIVPVVCGQ
ncbi:MAG: peptidoglycan-binding protein [Ancalomicrobiaceae bacterium]|nr:peptidoglycan-binding protein [Ancalomicrobiaceae bacterium]